jgi:hypothetical protein
MFLETFTDALKRRRADRRKLKLGSGRQRRVGRTLRRCRRHHRCGTEACRVCMREFRISWLGEAIKIMAQRPHWTRCSVITKDLLIPYKQLTNFDLDAAVKRLRKRLERSGVHDRLVLGALDVSLNAEKNVITGWQWHLYLLIEGQNDEALKQSVKDAFPPESTAFEPYDFAQVSNPIEVVTYTYKSLFQRRSGYNTSQGNHRAKGQGLKGSELRELLSFLAKYKVGARLILRGVSRNGQRLVLTPAKRSSARS